ncbi:hypothetical protein [Phytohabitans rumicis]|uniref:Uncharacterized protein n=1 Tax=Phytohabitans rumicis TaxID=1076125 RepID=A0A6V8LCB5_9ACTN|nr:hypothetical protein [Phytohabitans rumicis]GFJ93280.1 hypothetical protein Prum_069220 [Phytohabitans rumicis]
MDHLFTTGTSVIGLANAAMMWPMLTLRVAASRWIIGPLLLLTAATAGLFAATIVYRDLWTMFPAAALMLMIAVHWDNRLSARRGWTGGRLGLHLAGRRIRRGKVRFITSSGRRMHTLDEIRAEYAQTILDNAAHDQDLDQLLNETADDIEALLRQPDDDGTPRSLDAITVASFANRVLDQFSDPDRRPPAAPYRGYSRDMLTIAALCRLGGRLPTVVPRT